MNSYLTENQFFAPISLFSDLQRYDCLMIESQENYQKRGFRNRCIIDSAQGPLTMSIPLAKGKNEKMPIRDVNISYNTDWVRLHLETIKSSYGNAPYFEHVYEEVTRLYALAGTFLHDFNNELRDWILNFIELDIKVIQTDYYQSVIVSEHINDRRNLLMANNYNQTKCLKYPYAQVFEENHGFLPNLSILDLIFCTGKASLTYLS